MACDMSVIKLLEELSNAPGAPGFEDEVLAAARGYASGLGDIREDKLRNLYIYRKENRGNRPLMMLDAHSDEVGFMVQSIRSDGMLRVVPIGSWLGVGIPSSEVLVRSASGGYVKGMFALKPKHFLSAEEIASGGITEIKNMLIDVGVSSREEAVNELGMRIGEPVVPATRFSFDEKRGVCFGKAFDCRAGVAAMLETLGRLEGTELPVDVVAVLSAQEELGERGCTVAVNTVKPDIALAFEGCPADDTFMLGDEAQSALGKGPMLRHMDVSIICSPRYQRFALDTAHRNGIKVQEAVRSGGGNDGAKINLAAGGVPVIVAGVPVRYAHSMSSICTCGDILETAKFAEALLKALTPEVIGSF